MITFTKYKKPRDCFHVIVQALQPELILDIGSRNGKDALILRRHASQAEIIAFEATPELAHAMQKNVELRHAHIDVRHCAVGDTEGTAQFSIFNSRKKMGSLLPSSTKEIQQVFTVPTIKIDSLPEAKGKQNIALWIDVEGSEYQVLEGARETLSRISVLHVEVETKQFWHGQKDYSEVRHLLESYGFGVLSERIDESFGQGNVVFIQNKLLRVPQIRHAIHRANRKALLQYVVWRTHIKKLFPTLFRVGKQLQDSK